MKIPLYILGIIKRYGPQHGYQIKKIIAERISDFTQIKLPVIYYHLEKMKGKGLLSAEKDANKTDKTIYSITNKGEKEFKSHLENVCDFRYRPEFVNDALFFFMDSLDENEITDVFTQYIDKLENDIQKLQKNRSISEKYLSDSAKNMSAYIFEHHACHFQAELTWAKEVINSLKSSLIQE
jgi:DNA-binding PadR family transcriptional regulator